MQMLWFVWTFVWLYYLQNATKFRMILMFNVLLLILFNNIISRYIVFKITFGKYYISQFLIDLWFIAFYIAEVFSYSWLPFQLHEKICRHLAYLILSDTLILV